MNQNEGIQMTPKAQDNEDYRTLDKLEFSRRIRKQPYYQTLDSDEEGMLYETQLLDKSGIAPADISSSMIRSSDIDTEQEEEMIKFIRLTIAGFSLLVFWCFGRYSDSVNWVSQRFFSSQFLVFVLKTNLVL